MRLFTLFMAGWLFSQAANPPLKMFYVHVNWDTRDELKSILEKGLDVGGVDYEKKLVTLILPEPEIQRVTSDLKYSHREEIAASPDSQFKKYTDIVQALRSAEENYPHLAAVEAIGKSIEGRDILGIKLSAHLYVPETGRKPTVLFDAMHHAREVMTPEVALDIVDFLTKNYETDAEVQKWMNEFEIWVVPMVNPDGNNKVWNGNSMWRKNARNGHGVDINRNYPYDWGTCGGSSGSTSSDTYRGTAPASEPETNALMDLAKRIKPEFNISYHSFSEIVIYPYGCEPKRIPSPDNQTYEAIGRDLGKVLVRDSGSGNYTAGTSYELLYNVDGGSLDWMYNELKTRSYVIEMNSSSQGFQPSYAQWRDKTVTRQREGWKFILRKMSEMFIDSSAE